MARTFFDEMGDTDNGHAVDVKALPSVARALAGGPAARAELTRALLIELEALRRSPAFTEMVRQSAGFTVWHEGLWFQQVVAGARAVAVLARGKLPLDERDLLRLADQAAARPEVPPGCVLTQIEGYTRRAPLTAPLRQRVESIRTASLRSSTFAALTARCEALLR